MPQNVLIIGAGKGLSASLTRLLTAKGYQVSLACRNPDAIAELCQETGATSFRCDVSVEADVKALFTQFDTQFSRLDWLIYNAGFYQRGPIHSLDPQAVNNSLAINASGAFLAAQEASKRMLQISKGIMQFTGASAGMKGYAQSAPFAMGKFALRGLCQSLARELAPHHIHVTHFVIDGLIYSEERGEAYMDTTLTLDPDAIAENYYQLGQQHSSAWTWEVELRPSTENF